LGLLAWVAAGPPTRADGIPLGKFQFYPSMSITVAQDDNLFDQNDDVGLGRVSDQTADFEAPLLLRLPFRASLWELEYTPGLKRYQDNSDLDGDTHRLASELDLVFSTGSRVNMQASYVRDFSNLQQATEELSESQFSFVDYEIIRARGEYEQPFGQRHGMEAILDFESLRFEDTDEGNFTDYSNLEMTVSYVRLMARDMRLFVGAVGGSNDLDQPRRGDCRATMTGCSQDDLILKAEDREDHWSLVGAQVGLERQFDDKNRARLDLGYRVLSFDHSDDSDFSGLVARLRYSRRFSDALSVNGELAREPIQSSFDVNNYFVMQLLMASVQFEPRGTSLYYFGALSLQTNNYPDETELRVNREFNRRRADRVGSGFYRRDKIGSVDLGMGMLFSPLTSLDLTVSARQRDSNMTPIQFDRAGVIVDRSTDRLSYDDLVVGLTFRYGFTPRRDYI
jgi:hypothetical protein